MGYSCTQAADNMLGVICHTFNKEKCSNMLTLGGKRYFFERGKEQHDGAITGTLFRMLPNDMAQRSGSFRINADGTIARFPGITAQQKQECENTLRDMEARNPSLLRNWAMGRI